MSNPVKKPSWWEEFKTFAIKGNAMALAVGTIIGAAFSTIMPKAIPSTATDIGGLYGTEIGIVMLLLMVEIKTLGKLLLKKTNFIIKMLVCGLISKSFSKQLEQYLPTKAKVIQRQKKTD